MNKLQLYLNDVLIDLSDDSPLALSFAINNLADVKNQNSNTSNQFKVPMTVNNRKALGVPDTVGLISELPYRRYAAKIIQDGIEILPTGFGELNGISDDFASITVLSGNVDFFDLITGKIYDMGSQLAAYEHVWNLDNVVNSQNKNDGWIYPIIDYGQIPEAWGGTGIDVRNLRPAFFLHTIIEEIAKLTGFEITGSMLDIPIYKKLLVAFANDEFEHGDAFKQQVDNLSSIAVNTMQQEIPQNRGTGTINFNNTTLNPSGSFNTGSSRYTAKETINVDVQLKYSLQCRDIYSGGSQASINIRLVKAVRGGGEVVIVENKHYALDDAKGFPSYRNGNLSYYLDQEIKETVALDAGDQLFIQYQLGPSTDRVKGDFYNGAVLTFKNNKSNVNFKQKIQVERIFPDISQKDLLKDAFQKFGVICSTDNYNRKVTFALFGDIVKNIPIAKDWSDKVVDQGKSLYFQIGDYSQVNYMVYKPDDAVSPATGRSKIIIDDKTLPAESNLFESVFAASSERPYYGGSCSQILKIDPLDEAHNFSIKTEPRILVDKKVNLMNSGAKIAFVDGATTRVLNGVVSIPYFTGSDESLDFEYLRKTYYPELEQVLTRSKKVIRYFMLTPIDIAELNLLIPIYLSQESAYFYISKIENYVKGRQTKVELIRL